MLLTEEQARKETCPHITYCINEQDAMQDGRAPIYVHQNCQASDCKIAWRWAGYYPVAGGKNDEAHGYCGISGRPE